MALSQQRVLELFDFDFNRGLVFRKVTVANAVKGALVGCEDRYKRNAGRVRVSIDDKLYLLPRVIWLAAHGYMPNQVDHRDNDPTNNRLNNLRDATGSQNKWNRGKQANNTSGYKGVYRKGKRWAARVASKGVITNIGTYDTPQQAYAAYCAAAKVQHGAFFHP